MIRLSRARSERGAVFVFVAGVLVVLVLLSGLVVDLGRQRNLRRSLQADADVIALDLVRLIAPESTATGLNGITLTNLNDSRLRNGLPAAAGFGDLDTDLVTVEWGRLVGGDFTPAEVELDAVRVTLTEDIDYLYLAGDSGATRSAVAAVGDDDIAGFTVGSRLASVDTGESALLNPLVSSLLGGDISLTAVDYNGLVGAHVSLAELAVELGLGSATDLLGTSVALYDLMIAQADALRHQVPPKTAAATVLETIALTVPAAQIPIASLVDVALGAEEAAATAGLDVFGLVMSQIFIANGTNAVSIPNLAIAIPGVTRVDVGLAVTERPRIAFGPVGTRIRTAQVKLTVTPTIPIKLDLGLASISVTAAIPISIDVGGAWGTLTGIDCSDDPSIDVSLEGQAVSTNLAIDLDVLVQALGVLGITLNVARITVHGPIEVDTTSSPAGDNFSYTGEFLPPVGAGSMTQVSTPNLGLGSALNGAKLQALDVDVNLLGLIPLPLPLGGLLGPLALALNPVLGLVDTLLIQPLTNLLGIDLGGGDLGAVDMQCGFSGVALVG